MLLAMALGLLVQQADVGRCEGSTDATPWFAPGDYPAAALRNGEEGAVDYAIDVDADGCVTGCTVTHSSGHRTLDDVTCAILMRRARFSSAARDAAGNRVASSFRHYRWWILPDPIPPGTTAPAPRGLPGAWVTNDDYPPAALRAEQSGDVIFRLDLDEAGRVTNCTIRASSGSDLLDQTTCGLLRRRARLTPARDASGNPIPSQWSNGFRWSIPE